jgi:uncharacterized phage protein (TIGR01671 family)
MNRQLEFRIWRYCHREKSYKFYYLNNCQITRNDNQIAFIRQEDEYVDDSLLSLKETNEISIQQFTGLKDKNGIQIYEGDILKDNECLYQVLWNKTTASFIMENLINKSYFCQFDFDENEQMEIMGNIFENPNLLT